MPGPQFRLERTGDWDVAMRMLGNLANPSMNIRVLSNMVSEGGKFLIKAFKMAIDTGRPDWPPLAHMTIAMKGHTKPLVGASSSDIRNGIKMIHRRENASVGIPEGARTREGDSLDVVAAVQEFGAVIPVTPKMRRWFAAQGYPLRADTQVIAVPRRALFKPVYEENKQRLATRMTDAAWDKIHNYFDGATTLRKLM